MRKLFLILFSFLIISFTVVEQTEGSTSKEHSDYFVDDNPDFTYVHVYIDGKHFIYVYLGDLIWEIHEVEE